MATLPKATILYNAHGFVKSVYLDGKELQGVKSATLKMQSDEFTLLVIEYYVGHVETAIE